MKAEVLGNASGSPPLALVQAAREGEGLSVAGDGKVWGEWFCLASLPGRTVAGRGVHGSGLAGHRLAGVKGMGML